MQRRVIYAFGLDTTNSRIIIIFNSSSHSSYKSPKYDDVSLTPYFPPSLFSIKLIYCPTIPKTCSSNPLNLTPKVVSTLLALTLPLLVAVCPVHGTTPFPTASGNLRLTISSASSHRTPSLSLLSRTKSPLPWISSHSLTQGRGR